MANNGNDDFKLSQTAAEVQKAITNALNPSTTLTEAGNLADAKAVGDALKSRYTKTEIDKIMGAYVNDIAALIGGDANADS